MTEIATACVLAIVALYFVFGLRRVPLPEDTYQRGPALVLSMNGVHKLIGYPKQGPPIPFARCPIEEDERAMRLLISPMETIVASKVDEWRQLDVIGPWGGGCLLPLGAQIQNKFLRQPVQYLLRDEIDAWPLKTKDDRLVKPIRVWVEQ